MPRRTPLLIAASLCLAGGSFFLGEAMSSTHTTEQAVTPGRWKLEGHWELARNDGALSITVNVRFARNTEKVALL